MTTYRVTNNWDRRSQVVPLGELEFLGLADRLRALRVGESLPNDVDPVTGEKLEFFETYTRIK